jgi:uncharacterized membrane protein YfcA
MPDWVYAVGIPVVTMIAGAIGKRIIRGRGELEDWFLGVGAALTAITTGLASAASILPSDSKRIGFLLVVSFAAYLMTLSIHQEHERRQGRRYTATNKLFLGLISNAIGFGSLTGVLLLLK